MGRKDGREEEREERQRGHELHEAERVVKFRLVQAKKGETRQWKFSLGQLQVGAKCHIHS